MRKTSQSMKTSKKIAIIGAGFSGLGLCYHLLQQGNVEVFLFDPKEIGEGVSGMASGLLHPYPGESARLSWQGKEALNETKSLLAEVTKQTGQKITQEEGILRLALNEKQEKAFRKRAETEEDIEWWEAEKCHDHLPGPHYFPGIFIRLGICVNAKQYLKGLWKICEDLGAKWTKQEVDLSALEGFDQVVIAAGAGIRKFKECNAFPVRINKGQLLVCEKPYFFNPSFSLIGKGYLAFGADSKTCTIGSTYEYDFLTETPCLGVATDRIFSQVGQFIPSYSSFKILDCLSGMRVCRPSHYFPIVGKLKKNLWVITAMGSRGLLYHSFLGKKLAAALQADDDCLIPKEVRI